MKIALILLLATGFALAANPAPPNRPMITFSSGCTWDERQHCATDCYDNTPRGWAFDGVAACSRDKTIAFDAEQLCDPQRALVNFLLSLPLYPHLTMPDLGQTVGCIAPIKVEQYWCFCKRISCGATTIEGIPVGNPRCPVST